MIKLAVKYVKKEEEQTLRQWLSEHCAAWWIPLMGPSHSAVPLPRFT